MSNVVLAAECLHFLEIIFVWNDDASFALFELLREKWA